MTYQLFYILPTSGALIAMRLRRIHQALLTILGLLLVAPQGLFAAGIDEQLERYPGRWTRDRIGIGGGSRNVDQDRGCWRGTTRVH